MVETFASAESFLAFGQSRDMACLIVDLRLPDMSGLELQKYLADAHSRIPIIFITAHGDQATRERALRDGAVAFLEKPVRQEALVTAIRSALQRRRDENVQSR
jgi:FixJ family two-component response regulator